MVLAYVSVGTILLLTHWFPEFSGSLRVVLGLAFWAYALFRAYITLFRKPH
ncbi:MAG: hypothetical protein NZL95_07595 [Chitinophagales bacterium]|nr:hypothetical protein [Chitinophagales bacterium]MDW8428399.1 hypothetical protein [Chitinophagales bacterium]